MLLEWKLTKGGRDEFQSRQVKLDLLRILIRLIMERADISVRVEALGYLKAHGT